MFQNNSAKKRNHDNELVNESRVEGVIILSSTYIPVDPIIADLVRGIGNVQRYATYFIGFVGHVWRVLCVAHTVPYPEHVIYVETMRPTNTLPAETLNWVNV